VSGGTLLLGTHLFDARGDAAARQRRAAAANAALQRTDLVNVQGRSAPFEYPDIATLATLTRTARDATRVPGRPTPVGRDICDALARAARARGHRYFAMANGDAIVTQAAVDRVLAGGYETVAFSRRDVDADGRELGVLIHGIDMWAFDVAWWEAHRHRFRSYVIGGPCIDNVFAAIMMTHGRGFIENREGEIRHVVHPRAWAVGPYERYNYYLAALDSPYFTMWARYIAALEVMRRDGASAADEQAMARATFVRRWSPFGIVWHAGRSVRARWRYARDRARVSAPAAAAPR